jgi:Tol biopolymer transport system component
MLAGIVLGTLAWGASPAGAAFPGPDGKIAFSRHVSFGDQIVVANPGGARRLVVTSPQNYRGGENSFLTPEWAPDGARLVTAGSGGGLWTVYANGAGLKKVFSPRTASYEGAQDPTWSPDGKHILFDIQSKSGSGGRTGLWSMRADGTRLHRILAGDEFDPVLSPNGSHLAYTKLVNQSGPTWDLEVARPDGSHPVALYSGTGFDAAPARVSWSPDSRTLVFGVGATAQGIDAVAVSGGPVRTLIGACAGGASSCAVGADPEYSPNGTRIVYTREFAAAGQPWSFEIWSMAPDGSHRRREIRGTQGSQPSWGRTPTIALPSRRAR